MKESGVVIAPALGRLSEEVKSKVRFIFDFDLSRVKARMQVDYPSPQEHLNLLERELKRFLALFVLEEGSHFFAESADDLWHYFILHTHEYKRFCEKVYGRFLNHVPMMPSEAPDHLAAYSKTKMLYAKYFGAPPLELWGEDGVCCMGCNGSFVPAEPVLC